MNFSFLYCVPETPAPARCVSSLSLDKIIEAIMPSISVDQAVQGMLASLPMNKENILYRQCLCKIFSEDPKLLEQLSATLSRYEELESEWKESRKEIYTMRSGIVHTGKIGLDDSSSFLSLKINAEFCVKVTAYPEILSNILHKHKKALPALAELDRLCNVYLSDESFCRLRQIAAELAVLESGSCSFILSTHFNRILRLNAFHIRQIGNMPPPAVEKETLLRFFSKSSNTKLSDTDVPVNANTAQEMAAVEREAVDELNNLLDGIIKTIYGTFKGIAKDLVFYRFAVRMHEVCAKTDIPLCYPEILPMEQDTLCCTQLYDLFLVGKNYANFGAANTVVPNDVSLMPPLSGMLIRGKNNMGKTVFLRSVGTAQLFAQSGLPIAAKSASVSIKSGIFAQFAHSEADSSDAAPTGRFEGEVKELYEIIQDIRPHSLLLLNETFQTTAFEEGAAAMHDILDVLSGYGCQWLFVTHLLLLFEMTGRERTLFAQASDAGSYKLELL